MSEVSYQLLLARLAEQWQLSEEQLHLLQDLGPEAIPQLLEIDTTLQQLFCASPLLAELWMTTPNKAFANRSPMEVIEQEGKEGLETVVQFLCLQR